MIDRLRLHLLNWWARLVCRWPIPILLLALIGTGVSVGITYKWLGFESDRNALLGGNLEWNQRFDDWRVSFEGNEDFYLVVDPGDPSSTAWDKRLADAKRFVNKIGPLLQSSAHVERVVWGFGRHEFSPRTVRLLPLPQFQAQLDHMRSAAPLLASDTPQALFTTIAQNLQKQAPGDDPASIALGIDQVTNIASAVAQTIQKSPHDRASLAALVERSISVTPSWQYLATDNERLLLVRITPRKTQGSMSAFEPAINDIRSIIKQTLTGYQGIEAGLTGIDVVETDETTVMTRDSTVASIVAVVLITCLLLTAFKSWRSPVLAMLALLMGVSWSFGFATLVIGHLQVLSIFFTVILLGLGIAYGIHLASRLELVRNNYPDTREGFVAAMQDSMRTVGPGVVTGAITTAAAFCTTLLTDFQGVAEMGAIAAAGTLLCLIAMLSVYPALASLFHSHHFSEKSGVGLAQKCLKLEWAMSCVRQPGRTLITVGVIFGLSLALAAGMQFDYDLMKLQPRGVDSVDWQERIVEASSQSIWSGTCVVDSLAQAKKVKAKLLALETIGRVDGIGLLDAPDDDQKIAQLKALHEHLIDDLGAAHRAIVRPPGVSSIDLGSQAGMIQIGLKAVAEAELPQPIKQSLAKLESALVEIQNAVANLSGKEKDERLLQLQREYTQWRVQTADRIGSALDTSELVPGDFPKELLRPYVARTGPLMGRYALEVHPKIPDNAGVSGPLDPSFLPRFIADMESACVGIKSAIVTGVVAQIYHSGNLIKESYKLAGLYALLIVLVLVWLDFWSLRLAALSLVPVAIGFTVTFGVMRLIGESINPANIIVLPLMFGIGVDSGVHLLHRFRQDPKVRPLGLSSGTGMGITITSLTTIIGFSTMLIARHRGIASLGFVLALGVALTLLACWTAMPAWLEIRAGSQQEDSGSQEAESSDAT